VLSSDSGIDDGSSDVVCVRGVREMRRRLGGVLLPSVRPPDFQGSGDLHSAAGEPA
jgi:hypothetical protein